MPPHEHLLTTDAQVIAFGRGKVSALQAQGLEYVTQHFPTPFGTVTVRLSGEHAYISGGGSADYLVWPTSDEHPEGVVITEEGATVPPEAVLSLTGGGIRVEEHTDKLAGPHDWVSANGKRCLTYDHGHDFRYSIDGAYETRAAVPGLFQAGKAIVTEQGVKGAAVVRLEDGQGNTVERTVYAAYLYSAVIATALVLRSLEKDSAGEPVEIEFARFDCAAEQCIAQPTFFSGDGTKLLTVLERAVLEADGGGGVFLAFAGAPRFILQAEISLGGDGALAATFSQTPLVVPAATNESTDVYTPPGFVPGSSSPILETTAYAEEERFYVRADTPGQQTPYLGRLDQVQEGRRVARATTVTTTLVGVDISSSGEALVITITDKGEQTQQYAHVATLGFNYTKSSSLDGNGFPVDVNTGTSYYSLHTSSSAADTSVTDLLVNGTSIYLVVTNSEVSSFTSSSARVSDINDTAPQLPPPNNASTQAVVRRHYSLREIDARDAAVAVVEGEGDFISGGLPGPRPYKVRLALKFRGGEYEKPVFDGVALSLPPYANGPFHLYRVFASRRAGELVACFSPSTTPHGAEARTEPTDYLNHLAQTGTPDRTPLIVLRRKEKTIAPKLSKFEIGEESDFRFDSVHLL